MIHPTLVTIGVFAATPALGTVTLVTVVCVCHCVPLTFSDFYFFNGSAARGLRPETKCVVHYRALVFLYTSPTWVVLCYPKPVLYPPSCWLIGYPLMIRAQGHHTLQR